MRDGGERRVNPLAESGFSGPDPNWRKANRMSSDFQLRAEGTITYCVLAITHFDNAHTFSFLVDCFNFTMSPLWGFLSTHAYVNRFLHCAMRSVCTY